MLKRSVLIFIGCLAPLASTVAHAQSTCALPLGPLAGKKSVALGIFSAIADGLESRAKRAKYDTEIRDGGDSWSVFESLKGGDSVRLYKSANGVQMESVHETMGGGGVEMSVDKCTAVVSGVYFAK